MYRCIIDMFGYCVDKPDCEPLEKPILYEQEVHHIYPLDGCKNTPKNCKHYKTLTEVVKER